MYAYTSTTRTHEPEEANARESSTAGPYPCFNLDQWLSVAVKDPGPASRITEHPSQRGPTDFPPSSLLPSAPSFYILCFSVREEKWGNCLTPHPSTLGYLPHNTHRNMTTSLGVLALSGWGSGELGPYRGSRKVRGSFNRASLRRSRELYLFL